MPGLLEGVKAGTLIGESFRTGFDRRKKEKEDQEEQRKKTFFQDARTIKGLVKRGMMDQAKGILTERGGILREAGIPSDDSDLLLNMFEAGRVEEGMKMLEVVDNQGVESGFLSDPNKGSRTAAGREKERQFKILQGMPEGDARNEFARLIGAKGKQESLDDKLAFQVGKQKKVGDIKTNQRLNELKRIETETEDKRSMLELRKITIDETKIKNLNDRQLAVDKKNSSRKEARNAIDLTDGLLKGDSFSSAFGRFNNLPPEGARSQANIDARAQVDQVTSLISLEAREKLKGQGTITDSETATLAKSATLLANPLISDKLARRELRRVRGIFEDAEDRNRLKRETIKQQTQQTQPASQGGQSFSFDAQGNLIQ